ncbi:MAG TPA: hypothetical protein VGK71_05855 [Nitrospirota bacterium]|jgi:hypothetical protein
MEKITRINYPLELKVGDRVFQVSENGPPEYFIVELSIDKPLAVVLGKSLKGKISKVLIPSGKGAVLYKCEESSGELPEAA